MAACTRARSRRHWDRNGEKRIETPPPAHAPALTRSTESDVKHSLREIMNHQRLLHPHVVQASWR